MADNFAMPSSSGGLMRYNEEYTSSLNFSPELVIVFIVLIIAFVTSLKFFMPIVA